MTAHLLDGSALAAQIRSALGPRVDAFRGRTGRAPGLGIVLVGEHPASQIYVRNKLAAGQEIGVVVQLERLPVSAALADALAVVDRLNRNDSIDGLLVQTPLPEAMGQLAAQTIFDAIDPAKDVDGLHPVNVGRLVQRRPWLVPCTPAGIIELLEGSGAKIAGARAVVLGRSDLVGKPLAMLLLHRDATVTLCHSRTRDLAAVAASADILVAAIGRPAFVTREYVKPGATVIDVGINRITDGVLVRQIFGPESTRAADFHRRGSIIVGDVHPDVANVAGALSPVPGGIGPLTVAMLLTNTLKAAEGRMVASGH